MILSKEDIDKLIIEERQTGKKRRNYETTRILLFSLNLLCGLLLIAIIYISFELLKNNTPVLPHDLFFSNRNSVDIVDLIKNAHRYKGQNLTLHLHVLGENNGQNEYFEGDVKFYSIDDPTIRLEMFITVPWSLKIRNIKDDDEVMVTFKCTEGNLTKGNIASGVFRIQ
jgi:hypothetical protein